MSASTCRWRFGSYVRVTTMGGAGRPDDGAARGRVDPLAAPVAFSVDRSARIPNHLRQHEAPERRPGKALSGALRRPCGQLSRGWGCRAAVSLY